VRIVGDIPAGLPPFALPSFDMDLWFQLAGAAVLISVIGFVESVSVAQTLAAKRRERIDPDQELVGLGRLERGGGLQRRLSGDRRLCPLGGQLRCRRPHPCRRRLHRRRHRARNAVT
jgi:hypothetical protein